MKTLVVCYSYSGNTRRLAEELAGRENAELAEIKDKTKSGKRPGMLKALLTGCPKAIAMKPSPIQPIGVTLLADCDRIIIMAPVWAGHPAPPINNVFGMLPPGKDIEVVLVSGSGKNSAREKIEALVTSKGCTLTKLEDIKAGNR